MDQNHPFGGSHCKKPRRDTSISDVDGPLWLPRNGCPVGALLCDIPRLQEVLKALAAEKPNLARPKAVKDYNGRKAVHLTIEGATLLCFGQAPEAINKLLREGSVEFLPGLRLGAQRCRGPARSAEKALASNSSCFAFVELFAGIGGFRWALEALGGQCVFASEIDVDCQDAYAANFGSEDLYGDITAVDAKVVPSHELLTAGFPCQPFTRRGERLGFEDARGELFFEVLRILHSCKPKAFLLENVWNMQFLDGGHWDADPQKCVFGEVYKKVISCLEDVGYEVQSKQINSDGWVPQKRERLYFVGFRRGLPLAKDFQWPEPPANGRSLEEVLESAEMAQCCELTEAQWRAVQKSSTWLSGGAPLRFAQLEGKARTLTSSYKASFACTAELVSDPQLERPRFFTRRECARLMGFPDKCFLGNEHSENRAYHQLGNAVCPPVIKAIAEAILHSLGILPMVHRKQ
ncbi:unnamed protein product [Durusdinium trenchii]|uniref:DNA (cytosine-5-)-methyltransferase n=1 Tax=Durusdinium trenchii TaxID=1381693 RepID=A0ABP0L9M5_9DINO